MKVRQIEPQVQFKPVVITLETQEEIDAIFAVLNHGKILRVLPILGGWWSVLEQFTSSQRHRYWNRLNSIIFHN